jgi:hypothetical protein
MKVYLEGPKIYLTLKNYMLASTNDDTTLDIIHY